jgi:AraC-like DNA-binding protein
VNENTHEDDTPEIIRGHYGECLKHFSDSLALRAPKGSRAAGLAKKLVAEFCGVKVTTVHEWLYGHESAAIGDHHIKLLFYLDMLGYRVIELERMPRAQRKFAELIGYGVVNAKQAADLLGYTTASTLYQVFLGKTNSSPSKEKKMLDEWIARKEDLKRRKEQLQGPPQSIHPPSIIPSKPRSSMPPSRHTAVVSIMEGLLVLMEEGSYETLSGAGLADLRLSTDTVLRLSAQMSTLSSKLIRSSDQRKGGG